MSQGLITPSQLQKALETQRLYGGKLGTNLIELGFVTEAAISTTLVKQLRLPAITKTALFSASDEVIELIDSALAIKRHIVPFAMDTRLHIATSDPNLFPELDDLQAKVGKSVVRHIAPETWIYAALERYYGYTREARYFSIQGGEESADFEIEHGFASQALEYGGPQKKIPTPQPTPTETISNLQPKAKIFFTDFVSGVMDKTTPTEIFKWTFTYLHQIFSAMALFRVQANQQKGWLLSGIPLRESEFKAYRGYIFAQSDYQWNSGTPCGVAGAVLSPQLIDKLSLGPTQMAYIQAIEFRQSPEFILLACLPEGKSLPKDKLIKILDHVTEKASIATEILYLKQKLLHK